VNEHPPFQEQDFKVLIIISKTVSNNNMSCGYPSAFL